MRHLDALKSRGDGGRASPRLVRREVLDKEGIQGGQRVEAPREPDTHPHRAKRERALGGKPRETTALLGEPGRCVHVGDREADIYELFCAAHDVGTHFVIRSAYPRLAEDGTTKTDIEMQTVQLKGLHRLTVRDERGAETEAVLELRYRRILVLAPVGGINRCLSLAMAAQEVPVHVFRGGGA